MERDWRFRDWLGWDGLGWSGMGLDGLGWLSLISRTSVVSLGHDHTSHKAPDPIRTPKLNWLGPAQYWGGGPPGNSVVLCPFLLL